MHLVTGNTIQYKLYNPTVFSYFSVGFVYWIKKKPRDNITLDKSAIAERTEETNSRDKSSYKVNYDFKVHTAYIAEVGRIVGRRYTLGGQSLK